VTPAVTRKVVQRVVVDGGDDGRSGQGRAQILQQCAGRLQVHALGRLVEQQEARAAQVGLSHPKPAPLAA
jgi:hypothetical protein